MPQPERPTGPPDSEHVAVSVLVRGRVQGVGFRYFAHNRACRLGLVGYVRNLRDGSVRAVAEGPRDVLEIFAAQIAHGPAGSRVAQAQIEWHPATGQYDRFSIEVSL